MTRKTKAMRREGEGGFSLVELLVALVIVAIIAAIAIPMMMNQRTTANLASARSQVNPLAKEVASMLTGYTTLGSTSPATNTTFATLSGGTLTLTLTAGAVPNVLAQTSTVRVNTGTAITSSGFASGSTNWCIAVDFNGSKAVVTQAGLQSNATTCSNVGVAS